MFFVDSSLHIGKNDLLTFYDGDDLTANILGQYSGTRPHFKLFTSMADVTVQFQSDPATNIYGYNNGFVVHFFGRSLAFCASFECRPIIKREKKLTTKDSNDQRNQSMEDKSKEKSKYCCLLLLHIISFYLHCPILNCCFSSQSADNSTKQFQWVSFMIRKKTHCTLSSSLQWAKYTANSLLNVCSNRGAAERHMLRTARDRQRMEEYVAPWPDPRHCHHLPVLPGLRTCGLGVTDVPVGSDVEWWPAQMCRRWWPVLFFFFTSTKKKGNESRKERKLATKMQIMFSFFFIPRFWQFNFHKSKETQHQYNYLFVQVFLRNKINLVLTLKNK